MKSIFRTVLTTVSTAGLIAAAIWFARSAPGWLANRDSIETRDMISEYESESELQKERTELKLFLDSLSEITGQCEAGKFNIETMDFCIVDVSEFELSKRFSLSQKTVALPRKIPDEVFETYSTEFFEETVERPQLELYMGFFIIDRGDHRELFSSDGELIERELAAEPAYRRTFDGSPLFFDGISYYTVSDGALVVCDYSADADRRAVNYEYSADFATGDTSTVLRDFESGLYALADSDGELLTGFDYIRIYAFSEGLAAALCEDGSLSYIDSNGKTVIEGRKTFRTESARYAERVYRQPDTLGRESKGFLYFDESVVLAREQTVDIVYKENVMSDQTVALKNDGSMLGYPTDYTPISSADGAIVLERNGKYGVYGSDDSWKFDPIYDMISPFCEGLAVLEKDGKFGIGSADGTLVVPMLFDYISDCSSGMIAAYSDECGYVVLGKCLVPTERFAKN